MKTSTIRDFNNKIIGFIDEDDKGNKTIRDFNRTIKGYYRVSDNTTRDFYNRIVAHGDASAMLLK